MFNGLNFSKPLDEDLFNVWLENGRLSKIKYSYLLIIWDEYESEYNPVYVTDRSDLESYRVSPRETLVAVYDLYSESRIQI